MQLTLRRNMRRTICALFLIFKERTLRNAAFKKDSISRGQILQKSWRRRGRAEWPKRGYERMAARASGAAEVEWFRLLREGVWGKAVGVENWGGAPGTGASVQFIIKRTGG